MKLLFVYNAKAGVRAGLVDMLHKAVSPSTYPCALCAITYGPLGMDRRWRDYVKRLPFEAEFLHREELQARYPQARPPLPVILADDDGHLETLVSATDLRALADLDELAHLLNARLARRGRAAPA